MVRLVVSCHSPAWATTPWRIPTPWPSFPANGSLGISIGWSAETANWSRDQIVPTPPNGLPEKVGKRRWSASSATTANRNAASDLDAILGVLCRPGVSCREPPLAFSNSRAVARTAAGSLPSPQPRQPHTKLLQIRLQIYRPGEGVLAVCGLLGGLARFLLPRQPHGLPWGERNAVLSRQSQRAHRHRCWGARPQRWDRRGEINGHTWDRRRGHPDKQRHGGERGCPVRRLRGSRSVHKLRRTRFHRALLDHSPRRSGTGLRACAPRPSALGVLLGWSASFLRNGGPCGACALAWT